MARTCDVWVLTRANNREPIESEMARNPRSHLRFLYYDLPAWARQWKKGQRGVRTYYYLWQLGAAAAARRAHRNTGFDLAHHVTFVRYWAPSAAASLPIPFLWGPVGGGESAPWSFWPDFSARGVTFEVARHTARRIAENDPLVRYTARRSSIALATTDETAVRLRRIGAKDVSVLSEAALGEAEAGRLAKMAPPKGSTFRFMSLGRLVHLKGFHLALHAFSQLASKDSEYWIVGGGPEQTRLEALAETLGVAERVRFWGQLSRDEALEKFAQCHVLVHPTLHDSGGWVCLEAMASGRPVVCLNLGGPSVQITEETGIKVDASGQTAAIAGLATAMDRLATQPELYREMAANGRLHVARSFVWPERARVVQGLYEKLVSDSALSGREPPSDD
jgi:glycosyltransferase involved in cell wall biosynthesis